MPETLLPVIVNRSGGTALHAGESLGPELEQAFAKAGQAIALELVEGKDVAAALERHSAASRIVIGGGDGTIGTGAHFAACNGIELAVLPLGTRNHFARQLGIPLDLAGAARVASAGTVETADLGDCGGETFINNASVGAYGDLVRERQRSHLPKWAASIAAALRILTHLRPRDYALSIEGERKEVVTPMLFVGNNRYEIAEGKPGQRECLSDGRLFVLALAPLSLVALVGLAGRILLRRSDMRRDFVLNRETDELVIEATRENLEIVLDGERRQFALPLTLRIRSAALNVVVPAPQHG